MKAFLMAAGHGTRLKPITNSIPKCLVPVNGKPMLDYWFELFRKHGIDEVLININHFPDQVREYISNNVDDVKVNLIYEDYLLGSLGTIINNQEFIKNENEFFVFYSDNLTNLNISNFYEFHKTKNKLITLGLFRANNPESCGIADVDDNNLVINFEEKPNKPISNLANAGIYIFNPKIFNSLELKKNKILDIGYHLLPKYINQMNGFIIEDYLMDIGTHENHSKANEFMKNNFHLFS